MSSLKSHEKIILEKLFETKGSAGWVLNFNDQRFAEFFRENGININDQKYQINGPSKMKRLRAFWEVEPDTVVGRVLEALFEYACTVDKVDEADKTQAQAILNRLQGKSTQKPSQPNAENDFLKQEFSNLDLSRLKLDIQLEPVIRQRIDEIHKSLNAETPLATIFLCGSTLEGLLQDVASKQAQKFNQAKAAPRDKKSGDVMPFHDWTLDSLINVAHEVDLLSLDIKKYGHSLRDFRNYIHPRHQASQGFKPDQHTAKISWQVLQAAIANLGGLRK